MIRSVIFDFGNVIGKFDPDFILRHFCSREEDQAVLSGALFHGWKLLDAGTLAYEDYIRDALALLPERLHPAARGFFRDWYRYIPYMEGVPELIDELKSKNIPVYLLSNAPVYFSQNSGYFRVLEGFSGVLFSGDIRLVKPNREIYECFLNKFSLNPAECFFFDDLKANIEGAKACGIDGMGFDGDIAAARPVLGL